MNYKSKFMASICLLLLCLSGFGKDNTLSRFWNRVEVGTNIIPLIDSNTLNFENLMLKYYYNTEQSRAIRVNMYWSDIYYIRETGRQQFQSNSHFRIGHVNYYKFKPSINILMAYDFEYENYSYRVGSNPVSIYRRNKYYFHASGGFKYQFYKNWNIEFETTIITGLDQLFQNYQNVNGVSVFIDNYNNYFRFYYKPINTLTLNYKF